jgi:MFS family permease
LDAIEHLPQRPVSVPPWSLFSQRKRWVFVAVLFLSATSCFFDKNIISVLLEPIKTEFQVSDTLLGLLSGFCFAVFYAMAGVPVARWADRGNRRTVITVALTAWSAMTLLCGVAQSFWQLALARIGVGAGESGAVPPAHSLIADYFPPEQRATAIGIYTAAGTAGILLGIGVGGYVAAHHGWRAAFWVAGAPGFLLALITRFALAEPRLRLGFPGSHGPIETVRATTAALWRKKTFVYALGGCVLYTFIVQGALVFVPSFLIRVLQISLAQVSILYGATVAVASVVGTLGGGLLADRLSARDIRWLAWLPAAGCVAGTPVYAIAFSVSDLHVFLIFAFIAQALVTGSLPPIFAAIHAVCGGHRRAMAIAAVYFSSTLVGNGFGPLLTGAISDALSPIAGVDALRYALLAVLTVLPAAGIVFHRCHRVLVGEIEQ